MIPTAGLLAVSKLEVKTYILDLYMFNRKRILCAIWAAQPLAPAEKLGFGLDILASHSRGG